MRGFKIFVIIFSIVLCLLAAATYYLNFVFIPGPFKRILISKAHDILERDVIIKELGFNITQGVVLKGIRIADKEPNAPALLTIEEISLGLPLPDFFRTGNIVVPFATVRKPVIHISRLVDHQWNFSDLLPAHKTDESPTKPKSKKPRITIAIANIEQGQIEITDLNKGNGQTEIITDLNASAHLSLKGGIDFDAGLLIPAHLTALKLQGNFSPDSKELAATLDAKNLDAGYFINLTGRPMRVDFKQAILSKAHLTIKLKNGNFNLEGSALTPLDLTVKNNTIVQIKTTAQFDRLIVKKTAGLLKINCELSTPQLNLNIDDDKTLSGAPTFKNLAIAVQLGKSIAVDGDIELKAGQFTIGENKKFTGNYSGTNVHFQYVDDEVNLRGNFYGQNAQMILAKTKLRGELFWDKAFYKKIGPTLTISGAARMPRGIFQNESLDISGDLSAGSFVFIKDAGVINLSIPTYSANSVTAMVMAKKISGGVQGQDVRINITNEILRAEGNAKTKNLKIAGMNHFIFSGNPDITVLLINNPALKEKSFSYSGIAHLENETIQGLPAVNELNNIKGQLNFSTDELSSDGLNFMMGLTPISLTGNLKNFKNPSANITAKTDAVDVAIITPFFSKKLEALKINVTGQAQHASVSYNGLISSPQTADIKASAYVKNGELTWDKITEKVTRIQGSLDYQSKGLGWEDLMFTYKGHDYTASGSIIDFQKLKIATHLHTNDFDLDAEGSREDQIISITSLKGNFHKTTFDIKGNVGLQDGPPDADLNGQINLDLPDIAVLFPSTEEKLKSIHPVGSLAIKGRVSLPALSWQKMNVALKAESSQISLYGYDLRDLTMNVTTQDDNRASLAVNTKIYKGKLNIDGKMNLAKENAPGEFAVEIMDLDLAQLKNDIPAMKAKDFSGLLSLRANVNGPLASLKDMQGTGTIEVKEGRLLELNLLKGIWKYLLIKDFENIVFTDAHANFKVVDDKLTTENLIIKSSSVDLDAAGSLAFDGTLDFRVGANVHEAPIITSDVRGTPTALLAQAQKYMAIKLTGTVSNPQYKVKALPFKAIGNTTDSIFHGIQGMLEDVLQ